MERLRQRADFLTAAAGSRAPTAAFVLQVYRRAQGGPARVGFTVSRKVGTAVERNRVRRRLKAAVSRLTKADGVAPGHDYVLIARRAALTAPFDRLMADVEGALRRALAREGRAAARPAKSDDAGRRERGSR